MGALSRKWSPRRTTEMLAFYADSFGLIELGRTVAVEYGRLRAATEALGRPVPTRCGRGRPAEPLAVASMCGGGEARTPLHPLPGM
jgi:hypothetical protein